MAKIDQNTLPLFDEQQIENMVGALAQQIEDDYHGKELVCICPLRGSLLFFSDLIRKIDLPMQIDFVHLTSAKGESVQIQKDIHLNIHRKHVLIVEEIIDFGRTLIFLRDRILASNPASLKIATLLDKPARRELPIQPDYVGEVIDDIFVIGYGMDYEELGRNYKSIYHFAQ